MSRRKSLPPLSAKMPAELRPLMAAIAEVIETGEGLRGDKLDRKLTVRDLLEGGVAKLRVPNNPDAGVVPPGQQQDMAVPPRPAGFSAVGSFFGMVHLSWERPQALYRNHAFTNIYRSEEDNFAAAAMVGREAGAFYSDLARDDATVIEDPLNLPGYFYWITFSSVAGVEGPPHSAAGVFARPLPDAAYLLGQLSEKLGESQLEQALRKRIDLIDAPASVTGSVAARIEDERQERLTATEALARDIVTLFSRWEGASAAIHRVDEARASGDEALARAVEQVQTASGENEASIRQQMETINGLSAQATLTLDVNGHVSGVGSYNDGRKASFAVLADEFWVATPGKPASAVKPFMLVDGVNYLDVAFIREGSIQEGHLGPITFGKIFDAAGKPVTTVAGKLRADMLDVDELRVGSGNIEDAAITSAKIKDAAITSAKIGDAQVTTLQIGDNAVTVPVYSERTSIWNGSSEMVEVLRTGNITYHQPASVTLLVSALLASTQQLFAFAVNFKLVAVDVRTSAATVVANRFFGLGYRNGDSSIMHMAAAYLAAGTYRFEVHMSSYGASGSVNFINIQATGVMK